MTMKGISKDDVEWFSPEELAAAREEYLQEQEKEQPSPQVQNYHCAHSDSADLVRNASFLFVYVSICFDWSEGQTAICHCTRKKPQA